MFLPRSATRHDPGGRVPLRHRRRGLRADGSRNHHRAGDGSIGRDHQRRLGQSGPRRHELRAAGDDVERGVLHHPATAGRRLRRDRDRQQFSNDDDREHRGDGGRHGAAGREACRRRFAGRRDRDRRDTADTSRQREGHDGDQQQVHPGSAAGRRRAAPFAARPEPHRPGSQGREQRRRRTRQHRDWRRAGRGLGPDRRRGVGHTRRAVRAAVVDHAQLPLRRSDHGVRGRHERVQGGVRPRRRRCGELRVALGLEQMARQALRVLS